MDEKKGLTPKAEIKKWLNEVHDVEIPQRANCGVVNDGVVDEVLLGNVQERAKKAIQLNITKLYKTKVKKVAIVGTAMSYKKAPFDDPTWEIWGLNDHWDMLPRATRWFESQTEEFCNGTKVSHRPDMSRMDYYKKCPIPVYMPDHYDSAPMTVRYPIDEIQAWLSEIDNSGINYFTNTVSFQIALAIYEGFDIIHLYGVDMAVGSEYCINPKTKILTKDLRYINAEDLKIGQELLGFDEEVGKINKNRNYRTSIVKSMNKISRPCFKIKLEDGTELICSKEHRWLVGNGNGNTWLETEKLVAKGDYTDGRCSHIIKPLDLWKDDLSYDAGYIAGALDGEGHLSQNDRKNLTDVYTFTMGFAQRDNKMASKFEQVMNERQFKFSKFSSDNCIKYHIKGGRSDLLKLLGEIRPPRLFDKLEIDKLGGMRTSNRIGVIEKEFLGEQTVIALETSTGTFIAEGFASHNSKQRPSCEFFCGIAKGLGIELYIPTESDLLKCMERYGMLKEGHSKADAFTAKMRDRKTFQQSQVQKIKNEIAQKQNEIQVLTANQFKYEGSLADIDQTIKVWGG